MTCVTAGPPKAGPSKANLAEDESSGQEAIIQPSSTKELRNMGMDYSHHENETLTARLLQCWDTGTGNIDLDGREVRKLGSLAREGGIDKALVGKNRPVSLWRQLLSGVMCQVSL